MNVKFISYTGCFPTLCHGVLKIEVDGTILEVEDCLISGGGCIFDGYTSTMDVNIGAWEVDFNLFPPLSEQVKNEITALVNKNGAHGCCGGCV